MQRSALTAEQLLAIIQSIITEAPEFVYGEPLGDAELKWLARAEAAINAANAHSALLDFRLARSSLRSPSQNRNSFLQPLYDAYYRIELTAPEASKGAFIPAGDTWGGYAQVVKLLQRECSEIFVVDPYLTANIYTELAPHVAVGTSLKLLTSNNKTYHTQLFTAANKWENDASNKCNIYIKYAPNNNDLHDRLIIIDDKEVWLVSQSLKDIAKRSPASFIRAESELGQMKVRHYRGLWDVSSIVAQ